MLLGDAGVAPLGGPRVDDLNWRERDPGAGCCRLAHLHVLTHPTPTPTPTCRAERQKAKSLKEKFKGASREQMAEAAGGSGPAPGWGSTGGSHAYASAGGLERHSAASFGSSAGGFERRTAGGPAHARGADDEGHLGEEGPVLSGEARPKVGAVWVNAGPCLQLSGANQSRPSWGGEQALHVEWRSGVRRLLPTLASFLPTHAALYPSASLLRRATASCPRTPLTLWPPPRSASAACARRACCATRRGPARHCRAPRLRALWAGWARAPLALACTPLLPMTISAWRTPAARRWDQEGRGRGRVEEIGQHMS